MDRQLIEALEGLHFSADHALTYLMKLPRPHSELLDALIAALDSDLLRSAEVLQRVAEAPID